MNFKIYDELLLKLNQYSQKPRLLAVTKYSDTDEINFAIKNGVRIIGENRVESAQEKFDKLVGDVEKHFIGVVQTKKLRKIIELFDVIESISSIKQLKKVDLISKELNVITKIFLQFNISGEEQKSGFLENDIGDIIKTIKNLEYISCNGIMGIGSNSSDEKNINEFKFAKRVFELLRGKIQTISELSIGMSNDYKIALDEGSTIIRIGSLLFK